MDAAFQSNLGIYHNVEQGEFRGREGELQVPAELDGIVTGVFGLDQRRVARRTAMGAAKVLAPLAPADLAAHYNFPPGDGQGQQIGIAEFGGGYLPDDLQEFCDQNDVPLAAVSTVSVDLDPLTLEQIEQLPPQEQQAAFGETVEVMMDVQIVAGLCPGAQIAVYFATFDQKGWVDLLNRVIQDRPVTVSVSWGLAEDSPDWSEAARTAINERLSAAATLGITVCVASGDDGSGDQITDGQAHVNFPSSSPFVLSVGGTMITGALSAASEQAWWQSPGQRTRKGGGSTGGGVSIFFNRPQWQNVKVNSLNNGGIDGRVLPDIAALAGPPLYALTLLGKDSPNGGTSASTPLWAALIARINAALPAAKRQRFLTPLLYQAGANSQPRGQSGCRDITVGQNTSHPQPGVGYQAQEGYDAVTGWGTPDGIALLHALC
jgi:kumamolisin